MDANKFAAAMIVVLLLPLKAYAWGADGHRIVCAIAWEELKPGARAKVEELLDVDRREQFAEVCNWADEYRKTHPETAPWHFLDVPVGAKKVDLKRDCGEPKSCIVVQIQREADTLRSEVSNADKAMALKFLTHFVGDIHQPLHVSYAEDRGGNAITGKFLGKKTNLHKLWDVDLLNADGNPWFALADQLQTGITDYQRRTWAASTPLDWANESLAITLSPATQYEGQHSGFSFDQDYENRNSQVVLNQLSRAGVRLGAMLNSAFGR